VFRYELLPADPVCVAVRIILAWLLIDVTDTDYTKVRLESFLDF